MISSAPITYWDPRGYPQPKSLLPHRAAEGPQSFENPTAANSSAKIIESDQVTTGESLPMRTPDFPDSLRDRNTAPTSVTSRRSQAEGKEPVWFSCVAWDKLAEVVSKSFHKGDLVYVSGQVSLHTYSTESGEKRTVLRLNATDARLLSSKRDGNAPEQKDKEVPS